MFDVRTAVLVGAAVVAPVALEYGAPMVAGAGVAIPVYLTAGQKAALASFGATGSGVDSQSFVSLLFAGAGRVPTMTGAQAANVAQRLLAAVDAGAAAGTTEQYMLQEPLTGFLGLFAGEGATVSNTSMPRSALGKAYDSVKSMTMFTTSDDDEPDLASELLNLALEMDNQGYLITGKAQTVTIAGGLAAASAAVGKASASVAAGAIGDTLDALLELALTSPVLLGIAAFIAWRVWR